jgi:hypothetical protein
MTLFTYDWNHKTILSIVLALIKKGFFDFSEYHSLKRNVSDCGFKQVYFSSLMLVVKFI